MDATTGLDACLMGHLEDILGCKLPWSTYMSDSNRTCETKEDLGKFREIMETLNYRMSVKKLLKWAGGECRDFCEVETMNIRHDYTLFYPLEKHM